MSVDGDGTAGRARTRRSPRCRGWRRFTFALLLLPALLFVPGVVPRLLEAAGARSALAQRLSHSFRREVGVATIDVGWLPPRLVLNDLSIRDVASDSPPAVEAARVAVDLSPRALLARRVEPIALRVRDVRVRSAGAPAFDLAIASGALQIDDPLAPLPDADLLPVRLELVFAAGGGLRARGTIAPAGMVVLEAVLEAVPLAPFAPILRLAPGDGGSVDGSLKIEGALVAPARIEADLVLQQGTLNLGTAQLRGRARVRIDAAGDWWLPVGTFDLDAGEAEVTRGAGVRKAPGAAARLSGRFALRDDGTPGLTDLRLEMKQLDLRALPAGPRGLRIEIGP